MKVVIAHGSFGKPHENWVPWLEDALDVKGIAYLTPTFPTPDHQNYTDWKKTLDLYHSFGCFDKDAIFVGHSCGAIFLARYIIEKGINCKAYLSVAGYNEFYSGDGLMDKLNSSFYLPEVELAKVKKFTSNRISFYSDNDPYIPQEKLTGFADTIGAQSIVLKNGGHINKSAGYTTFEKLLEVIVSVK